MPRLTRKERYELQKLPHKEIGGIMHYKDFLGWCSYTSDAKRIPYVRLTPIGGVFSLDKLSRRIIGDNRVYYLESKWQAVFIMNGVHFLYPIDPQR